MRYGELTFSESYEPPQDEQEVNYGDFGDGIVQEPLPAGLMNQPLYNPDGTPVPQLQYAPQVAGPAPTMGPAAPGTQPQFWMPPATSSTPAEDASGTHQIIGSIVGLVGGKLLTDSWGWGAVGFLAGGLAAHVFWPK